MDLADYDLADCGRNALLFTKSLIILEWNKISKKAYHRLFTDSRRIDWCKNQVFTYCGKKLVGFASRGRLVSASFASDRPHAYIFRDTGLEDTFLSSVLAEESKTV